MKTIGYALLVAGLIMVAGSAYAGSCCAAKKDSAVNSCAKMTAGLDLTAEQQAKIAEIESACQASGSSAEACKKAKAEIRDLLNDEQKVKFDAMCEKMASGKGCGG